MKIAFPNESSAYREARNALLEQEIALRKQMEAVAAARRALPLGGKVPQDYVFAGAKGAVRLSELFSEKRDTLEIYTFMFPRHPTDARPAPKSGFSSTLPLVDAPCPSCTALLDQLDGAALHVAPFLDFVVVAEAPIDRLVAFADERGWRHLRLLSSLGTTYQRDYLGRDDDGNAAPVMNVFEKTADGVHHFWGSEIFYSPMEPGQDPRHVGTLEPMWNMYDLTRAGRTGKGDEQLDYCCH